MRTGKEMLLLKNPTLVFDGESFLTEEKGVKFIHPGIMAVLNKLSVDYNMVAVFPKAGKYKAMFQKFLRRGKEERVFPAKHIYADAEEVQVLLKKNGSPLISLNTTTPAFSVIPAEYRMPFVPDKRDFRRLLMSFEVNLIPIEVHLRPPVDLQRAFLRKEKRTRFEGKFG